MQYSDPLVNMFADEVESSVAFYTRRLGFVEVFRTPAEGPASHVELELGGFRIAFSTREAGRLEHGLDLFPGSPQGELVFWCDDVDAAFAELTDAGVPAVVAPHDAGPNRTAFLVDPDERLFSIVSRRPPSAEDVGGTA